MATGQSKYGVIAEWPMELLDQVRADIRLKDW